MPGLRWSVRQVSLTQLFLATQNSLLLSYPTNTMACSSCIGLAAGPHQGNTAILISFLLHQKLVAVCSADVKNAPLFLEAAAQFCPVCCCGTTRKQWQHPTGRNHDSCCHEQHMHGPGPCSSSSTGEQAVRSSVTLRYTLMYQAESHPSRSLGRSTRR